MSELFCGAGLHPRAQTLPVQIKELRAVHQVGTMSAEMSHKYCFFALRCAIIAKRMSYKYFQALKNS